MNTELQDRLRAIDWDRVLQDVLRIAAEYPDVAYSSLKYEYAGGKYGPGFGCLIGQGIAQQDSELPKLLDIEFNQKSIDSILNSAKIVITTTHRKLKYIQYNQDCHYTWGDCITNLGQEIGLGTFTSEWIYLV